MHIKEWWAEKPAISIKKEYRMNKSKAAQGKKTG